MYVFINVRNIHKIILFKRNKIQRRYIWIVLEGFWKPLHNYKSLNTIRISEMIYSQLNNF